MTETAPSILPLPSIIRKDKKVFWDFAQTTAYPAEIGNVPVYIYMTPYDSEELKSILRKGSAGYKREKREVELIREDRSVYAPLCDAHFVKLGNSTGTPEQQRDWLNNKRPELKPEIVEYTFGYLLSDKGQQDQEDDAKLDIFAESTDGVKMFQELYDEATDTLVRVDLVHRHSHPTEAQYRQYRSARRNKLNNRTSIWTITEDYNLLEKLYDAVVLSVEGGYVNGHPCTIETRSSWLQHIPLWHKLWVVEQIFGNLVEKNA